MPIGASRPLVLEKPAAIDLAQAARYFGARGEADAATLHLLEQCAVPLLAAAMPRAVWLEADVTALTEAGLLQGEDVMRHLEGCSRAILLAVTLGAGVDAQIRRAGVGDIAASVASDALGSALAEQAADCAEGELRQEAAKEGKYLTGRFSPGYGDWPITVQPRIAAVLDTARRAGICVTDSPQEHHGSAGRQRSSGQRTSGRLRALCPARPLRISKEGKDLCKRMNCLPNPIPSCWTVAWAPCCRHLA